MFGKKNTETSTPKSNKLPGPKDMPDLVGGHLVTDFNQSPDRVWRLKTVVRPRQDSKNVFDIRVFDEVQTAAKKVKVQDYTSLDDYSELILYEGWFDKESRQVQLGDKKDSLN